MSFVLNLNGGDSLRDQRESEVYFSCFKYIQLSEVGFQGEHPEVFMFAGVTST